MDGPTITTRARLPNFKIKPQIMAPFDFIVSSDPSKFPEM